jgi:hypothetical protein
MLVALDSRFLAWLSVVSTRKLRTVQLQFDVTAARPTGTNNGRPPLHVAMVIPPWFELPPSGYVGIESMYADLADGLLKRGLRVTLLGTGRNGTRGLRAHLPPAAGRPSRRGSAGSRTRGRSTGHPGIVGRGRRARLQPGWATAGRRALAAYRGHGARPGLRAETFPFQGNKQDFALFLGRLSPAKGLPLPGGRAPRPGSCQAS